MRTVVVTGDGLTVDDVVDVAAEKASAVLGPGVPARMEASRKVVVAAISGDAPVYGVNTGFGALADTKVPPSELALLQHAIIRSHAAGIGEPLDDRTVRAVLLLRARTLAAGYSGVRPQLPARLLELLGRGLLPVVPGKGSVGRPVTWRSLPTWRSLSLVRAGCGALEPRARAAGLPPNCLPRRACSPWNSPPRRAWHSSTVPSRCRHCSRSPYTSRTCLSGPRTWRARSP